MKFIHFIFLATATAALSTSASAQGPSTQKVVTVDMAQTMAQEAMAKCHADGYKVTVLVVDSLNVTKAMLRDDGRGRGDNGSCQNESHRHDALQSALRSGPASSARHGSSAFTDSGHHQRPGWRADQGW